LLGALIVATFGRRLGRHAHWPVVLGIGVSFLVSASLLSSVGPPQIGHEAAEAGHATSRQTVVVYHWMQLGERHTQTIDGRVLEWYDVDIPIELRVDGLSVMMLCMVTFVATLVAIFASGYMAGDPAYPRFFAEVGLFVFAMTGLVLSNNYVLTYAFWEGVGVCSYLLVGFWHSRPAAAAASKKAFLVNRLGDLGFAIALFWMWSTVPHHDLSYGNVLSEKTMQEDMFAEARLGISLLLLWAATAKSAQIPLYVWLPDAMEGPTPVSALIHAATMVTAGVYVLARSAALVFSVPIVPPVICAVGAITALFAALIALTQTDLKRVLAYSTISQLGYMFMALGTGISDVMTVAVVAAMFHLFTHAFFKALLFLGSGSVMHAMGHVIDMRRFGGLRKRMPVTCATFAVGGLALAGLFPLAGFWSKDEILLALGKAGKVADSAVGGGWAGVLYTSIYWVAVFTAGLTAFYTGRAFFLTFFGPEKLPSPNDPEADPHDHAHDHSHDPHFGHESPLTMTVPLLVLAAGTVLVGLLLGPTGWFEGLLSRTPTWSSLTEPEHGHGPDWLSIGMGTIAAVAGLALSWWMYSKPNPVPGMLAKRFAGAYRASRGKFFVDELYEALFVKPVRILAVVCRFVDVYFIDGLVRLVAWVPRLVGRDLLAPLQNGLLQFYAALTGLAVALLLLYLMIK
jgi:NADH-quinone oxidoreductase subunit L